MNSHTTKNLLKFKSAIVILITGCLWLPARPAKACDICGCFMGITPYDNQSSIALLYRYRSFHGYYGQPHDIFPSGSRFFPVGNQRNSLITNHNGNPNDYEIYRATEVRARYFLSRRLELNAILPYNSNSEQYNGNLNTVSGIGDVNIYAGYHLLRQLDRKTINQRLIVGGGVKLPTGKSDATNFEGIRYNTLTQTGTGSTDGFVYFNYLMGYKRAGLSLSATYKVNGENKEQEGIANSTTGFLNLFYNVKLSNTVKMVPSAQLAYEYSGGEKYQGIRTGEHVMNNLMSGVGVDVFVKNVTFNLAIQTKAWAAQDDHPQPAGRVVLGITYNFNQLYYLFN
jgi:hypothetical protein